MNDQQEADIRTDVRAGDDGSGYGMGSGNIAPGSGGLGTGH